MRHELKRIVGGAGRGWASCKSLHSDVGCVSMSDRAPGLRGWAPRGARGRMVRRRAGREDGVIGRLLVVLEAVGGLRVVCWAVHRHCNRLIATRGAA